MSSFVEVPVINIRNRKILRSIADGTFFDSNKVIDDPLSALRLLSAYKIDGIEYIKVWWKDSKTPRKVEITAEGLIMLEASDIFYNFLMRNGFREDKDLHKTLLTFDKRYILRLLVSEDMDLEDLQVTVRNVSEYEDDIEQLLAVMQKRGYVGIDVESQSYFATPKGLVVLDAADVYYNKLAELGFFDENKAENRPEKAKDAFAEFDGGESWCERHSGAAE